jgi:hypothetical protein
MVYKINNDIVISDQPSYTHESFPVPTTSGSLGGFVIEPLTGYPNNISENLDGSNVFRTINLDSISVGSGRLVIGDSDWKQDLDTKGVDNSGVVFVGGLDTNNPPIRINSPGSVGGIAGDPDRISRFGDSVSIGSGRIVIGEPRREPIDGGNTGPFDGAAYVLDYNGNLIASIQNTFPDQVGTTLFGQNVLIKYNKIFISSQEEEYFIDGFKYFGRLRIYDLDGNLTGTIDSPVSSEIDPDYGFFSISFSVGFGRIVIASRGILHIYDIRGNLLTRIGQGLPPTGIIFPSFGIRTQILIECGRIIYNPRGDDGTYVIYIFDLNGYLIKSLTVSSFFRGMGVLGGKLFYLTGVPSGTTNRYFLSSIDLYYDIPEVTQELFVRSATNLISSNGRLYANIRETSTSPESIYRYDTDYNDEYWQRILENYKY